MSASEPVSCFGCRHFQVTHDREWPYVCTRFALRSRRPPALEVQAASGAPCGAREERDGERPRAAAGPMGRA